MSAAGHVIDRAMERYGLRLALPDLWAIRDEIEQGRAEHMLDAMGGCDVWRLEYRGETLHPLYDPRTRLIVTLLTGRQVRRDIKRRQRWEEKQRRKSA